MQSNAWSPKVNYFIFRGLSREELVQLTETSGWCEQLVEYDCYSAPLK